MNSRTHICDTCGEDLDDRSAITYCTVVGGSERTLVQSGTKGYLHLHNVAIMPAELYAPWPMAKHFASRTYKRLRWQVITLGGRI